MFGSGFPGPASRLGVMSGVVDGGESLWTGGEPGVCEVEPEPEVDG